MNLRKLLKMASVPAALVLILLLATPAMAAEEYFTEPVERPMFYQSATVQEDPLEDAVDLEAFTAYFLQQSASCPDSIPIEDFNIPVSMLTQLSDFIWHEIPEAFHCYKIGYWSRDSILTRINITYYSYSDTAGEYADCYAQFKFGADHLLAGIEGNNNLSDVEKALLLHDRLAVWTEYDTEGDTSDVNTFKDEVFSAYGALGNRVAVCQGYAMAYMYLLDRVGIENDYCSSTALCHAWNIVYIDGIPYHTDVTWDDPLNDINGRVNLNNFLRSTEGFRETSHIATDYTTTPVDTRYDAAYWQKSNSAFQLVDGKLYYIDATDYKLKCVTTAGTKDILSVNISYARLASDKGLLLYSTASQVLVYDPVAGTSQAVYTHTSATGYTERIYGFTYEGGYLNLEIQVIEPSYNYYMEERRVRVALPEVTVKNGWYEGYYYESGVQITNAWREDENGRFHISGDGTLDVEMLVPCDGRWCYVGKDGYCVKNQWFYDDYGWYYFAADGYMVTDEWVVTGNKTYYCGEDGYRVTGTQIIDGVEYQFSSDGVLILEGAMTIVEHPEAAFVDSGSTATFSVTTQGTVRSYRWQYRKIYKWFDTSLEGYNTDTLTVPATGARNGYDYRCVVTFTDGTVQYSDPAELTVRTYLEITGAPNDQTVVLNYKGQFTVAAEGEGLRYQWQYKRPDGTSWIDTAMEGATKPTVLIETTTARDGYQYRCKVTDITGNIEYSNAATLRVLSFKTHPSETFAAYGSNAIFTVTTSVSSGFSYQWQFSKDGVKWTNTTLNGYNTATLNVPAKGKNGYQYRCVLTGAKNSKIESKAAILHSGNPVAISAQPANVTGAVGSTVNMTVTATNVYSYQWYYSNNGGSTWGVTTMTGATTDTLQISITRNRNGYLYRCVLKGLDGTETVTNSAKLTIK